MRPYSGKCSVGTGPDPYHGEVLGYAPCPGTPTTPGTTTRTLVMAVQPSGACRVSQRPGQVHQASFGYSHWTTIPTWSKPPFLFRQNGPVQKRTFRQKPRPNPHNFSQKVHFWRFWRKLTKMNTFQDTTGLWLFFGVFHCSRGLRFCLGIWGKCPKFKNILRKT